MLSVIFSEKLADMTGAELDDTAVGDSLSCLTVLSRVNPATGPGTVTQLSGVPWCWTPATLRHLSLLWSVPEMEAGEFFCLHKVSEEFPQVAGVEGGRDITN